MARRPRIDQYEQRTRSPDPTPLERVQAPDMDGGISRLLARSSDNVDAATRQYNAAKDRRAREAAEAQTRTELQNSLTNGINDEAKWDDYISDAVSKAPANGSGLVDSFDEKWTQFKSETLSAYKTEEGRSRAEAVYARIGVGARQRLQAAAAGLLTKDSDSRRRDALGNAEKMVNNDPTRYGAMEAKLSALVSELPGLTEQQRNEFGTQQRQTLALAAGYGAVTQNPYTVLADLKKDKPGATWAQHLEFDDVMRVRSAAQSEVNRRETEFRSSQIEARETLRADQADAFAARATGIPAQLPPRARYIAAFGKEGAQRYSEAAGRWQIFDVAGEAAFQPPDQAAATLATLRPKTQDGAAAASENYEAASRIYSAQRAQLEADPVAVLAKRDPAVAAARAALVPGPEGSQPSPAAVQKYFSVLRSKQAALGIEKPKLLPESRRTAIANAMTFDPKNPMGRVKNLATLRQQYGPEFSAVMEEVAPKLDGHARVLVNMEPLDAERMDAAYAQRDDIAKTVAPKSTAQIKAALATEFSALSNTLQDNPDGPARIAEHIEAATTFAQALVLRGSTPQDAAHRAADAVINNQYTYRDNLRIPKSFDDQRVISSLATKKADLVKAGEFSITPAAGTDPTQANAEMRNVIMRQGYWVTNENGTGVVLRIPHRSGLGVVRRADRRNTRVEYSFDELANLAEPFVRDETREDVRKSENEMR